MGADLIPLYRAMAESGSNFHGLSILQHRESIAELVTRVGGIRTMLDFGCGRGDAYGEPHRVYRDWGFSRKRVTLYDPAFANLSTLPKNQSDLVICSDVLEHIEEAEVPEFIDTLFNYTGRVLWASVCCRPAKKRFPDGRNLHVTVQPFEWWKNQFAAAWQYREAQFQLVETA